MDFLVSDDTGAPFMAIQVSMDISLPATLRRELDPLVATARYFGTRENVILTLSQPRRIDHQSVTVHAVSVWNWLLHN